MSLLHGKGKLLGFAEVSQKFPDVLGIGSSASLALAVFAEAICALLLAIGLLTRFAALNLVVTMAVAFFIVHKAALAQGERSGEMAFIYLSGFVTLLISGGGRFSLDAMLQKGPVSRE
jgi:putative oxidoreductase